jgi:hypothetical protein
MTMSRRNQLWLGLIAGALAAIAWFVQSERQWNRMQSALDALRQRRGLVEQESQRLENEISNREKKAQMQPASPKLLASQKTPGIGAPSAGGNSGDKKVRALLNSPQLQVEYLAAKQARLGRTYGPLFKNLHLSSDQITRFEAIAMQREEQELDIAGAVPAAMRTAYSGGQWDTGLESLSVGGPAGNPDIQAATVLQKQANEAFQTAATALLGVDGYAQLSDYERAMPVRNVADDLAVSLATSDSPLNLDQANQLTGILADASASYRKGGSANLGQIDWGQILQQAQSVLSAPQLSSLTQVVALRQSQAQLRSLIQTSTVTAGTKLEQH